jgi:tetratricopeptide (TPR) repeat protein
MKRQHHPLVDEYRSDGSGRREARIRTGGAWRTVITIAALSTSIAAVAAEPFIPRDDGEVLEILPRSLFASRDELTTLRRRLAEDPENAELASNVASRYLQLGKSEGDPRFYGYAQAALGPWWEAASAPPAILKLRAKLKERDHRYDEAVADLGLLVEQQPQEVQAWIELANIYRVQGKYAEARGACDRLSEFAGTVPTVLCSAPILAVTGKAEEAYASLTEILPTVRERWPTTVQWILTMQAEISRALGNVDVAEQHYRDGLANEPADSYLLRSYADLLLDQAREEEVVRLLREHTSDTGILLCAAIAARRHGQDAVADQWQRQLKGRFDESRLRGNPPHGQFEARYALELLNNPQRALALAEANWKLQKQPPDSRYFLEAAISAQDPARARPVVEFLEESGTQDVVLERLIQRVEGH